VKPGGRGICKAGTGTEGDGEGRQGKGREPCGPGWPPRPENHGAAGHRGAKSQRGAGRRPGEGPPGRARLTEPQSAASWPSSRPVPCPSRAAPRPGRRSPKGPAAPNGPEPTQGGGPRRRAVGSVGRRRAVVSSDGCPSDCGQVPGARSRGLRRELPTGTSLPTAGAFRAGTEGLRSQILGSTLP